MMHIRRNSPGLLTHVGRMIYPSTRRTAYLDFRRYYRTWSVARPGPYQKVIYTSTDARLAMDEYLDLLTEADYFDKLDDSLRVVLFPEFGFNVRKNYGGSLDDEQLDPYSHGAHTPLKTEAVTAILDAVRERASTLSPGVVFVIGGIAHDTGEKAPDGAIIGENVGFIVESGPERPLVTMSKYHHSEIDGWPEGYTLNPGTGPLDLTIADPSGGRPAQLSFFICLDASMGPFPQRMAQADLIAISGYGIPRDWDLDWLKKRKISAHAAIAANDSAPPGAITGKSGVLVQGEVAKHPVLKGMHTVVGEGWIGDALLWFYNACLGVRREDALATAPGFITVGTKRVKKGNLYATISPERLFPDMFDK